MSAPRIAIIGAGIAGLTAALAFSRRQADVTIIEQAGELSAAGAGLQLSPNACHILEQLGLLPEIEVRWQEIDRIALVSGVDLKRLADVPAGMFARRRWKAPYGALRRADLQAVLLGAVRAHPACRLVLGHRVKATTGEALRGEIADIVGAAPVLIVGADGVRSVMRQTIPGHGNASFSSYVAWRAAVELPMVNGLPIEPRATTAFLGPSTHLVAYPMADGSSVNLVAVTKGSTAAPAANLQQAFVRWHPLVRAMLAAGGEEPTAWSLFEVSDGSWHSNELVLIGDAAHAMMPFAAQGAAMAIEDAYELAEAFMTGGAAALGACISRRKVRIARVRRRTGLNRFAYHARGPLRVGRNCILALRSPESLAADLDWLYGYRPRRLS